MNDLYLLAAFAEGEAISDKLKQVIRFDLCPIFPISLDELFADSFSAMNSRGNWRGTGYCPGAVYNRPPAPALVKWPGITGGCADEEEIPSHRMPMVCCPR